MFQLYPSVYFFLLFILYSIPFCNMSYLIQLTCCIQHITVIIFFIFRYNLIFLFVILIFFKTPCDWFLLVNFWSQNIFINKKKKLIKTMKLIKRERSNWSLDRFGRLKEKPKQTVNFFFIFQIKHYCNQCGKKKKIV